MSRPATAGRRSNSLLAHNSDGPSTLREHDKAAYITLLESQLERVTATSLSLDTLTGRVSSLQSEVVQSSSRIQQLTRLLKLEQVYSATVKDEISKRVMAAETTVEQCQQQVAQQADEQRSRQAHSDEMERRVRAERQQRDVQLQAVVADMDERLNALQRQADEQRRQQEEDRRLLDDSRQQTDDRLTALTQRTDEAGKRMEALVRMMAAMDDRNRADADHNKHDAQRYQADLTTAKEQQRTQLLQCASDLRAFQLSIRAELSRRERLVDGMRRAVVTMSEEMDKGGAGVGVGGEDIRRWREEERREREERERRQRRDELEKMREDIYRYIDTRISSLPHPAALPPPPPPPTRPTSAHTGYDRESDQRAVRPRAIDDERWVERSMEQLLSDLTADRERERGKLGVGEPVERGGYRDGVRGGRSMETTSAHGRYRGSGTGVSGAVGSLSARQRGAPQNSHRPTRAGIGRALK